MCVKRKVPSQNLRSKTGSSATRGFGAAHRPLPLQHSGCRLSGLRSLACIDGAGCFLHPAALVACLGYAADRDGVSSISHVQLLARARSETAKYADVIFRSSFPRTSSFSQK